MISQVPIKCKIDLCCIILSSLNYFSLKQLPINDKAHAEQIRFPQEY